MRACTCCARAPPRARDRAARRAQSNSLRCSALRWRGVRARAAAQRALRRWSGRAMCRRACEILVFSGPESSPSPSVLTHAHSRMRTRLGWLGLSGRGAESGPDHPALRRGSGPRVVRCSGMAFRGPESSAVSRASRNFARAAPTRMVRRGYHRRGRLGSCRAAAGGGGRRYSDGVPKELSVRVSARRYRRAQ